MTAAGAGSMDSLDSLDEFGGFDMTRSQSVDGLFADSRPQREQVHGAGNVVIVPGKTHTSAAVSSC